MRIELDKPLTLSYIKGIFCIPYNAEDGNIVISAITTDSRLIKKGDLFIAIDGENISGEDFVESITPRGPTRPQVPIPDAIATGFSIRKTQVESMPVIAEAIIGGIHIIGFLTIFPI